MCSASYVRCKVALPAARRAAAPCCCGAGRAAIDRYSYPPGPQQQTRRTLLQRENGTPYRYIDPDLHTMRTVSIMNFVFL